MAQRANNRSRKESKGKPQRSRPQKDTTMTSKATPQRQDLDAHSELVSILQRNNMYDDLYQVLTANRIGLCELQELRETDIDQCRKEWNMNTRQTKKCQKLMRITHGNDFDCEWQMQMIVIGDKGVGKTSLIQQYVLGERMTSRSQYNHRRMNKTQKLSDDSLVNITILDGSAVTLRKEDYKNADCIFICFDVTSDQSFVNAKNKWSQKIKQYGIQNDDVIVFLLGCKNDSPSQWNRAEAEATQRVLHIGNVQLCSARTGDQVNGTFKTAAELVYQQKLEHKSSLKSNCMKNGYDISADIEQKDEQIQRLQQTKDVIQTKYESSKRQFGDCKRQIERMRNEKRDMDQKKKEYAQMRVQWNVDKQKMMEERASHQERISAIQKECSCVFIGIVFYIIYYISISRH
eukprot:741601_1